MSVIVRLMVLPSASVIVYFGDSSRCVLPCVFFFSSRRRHTRFKCDWSSDVCSSDLDAVVLGGRVTLTVEDDGVGLPETLQKNREIGRASCRERVKISVVAVAVKKKKRDKLATSMNIIRAKTEHKADQQSRHR